MLRSFVPMRRAALVPALLLAFACPAHAQEASPAPRDLLAREFGASGLTADMNSDELFGAVQARLGAYGAASASPALSLANLVLPSHVTVPLSEDGHWFVKLGAAEILGTAADHGARISDSASTTSLAQIQYRPWAGTLIGVGASYESNVVHAGGGARITMTGAGVRFDLLQRLGDHAGLALKASWLDGTTGFAMPAIGLSYRASDPRLYVQAGLIGNFGARDMGWIPQGWSLRPAAHLVTQRSTQAQTINSYGQSLPREVTDYAMAMLTARLQREVRGSYHLAPFIEAGGEFRLRERLGGASSDPALAYLRAGATMRAGRWGFFDAYLAHHDSLDGRMRANVVEMLASFTF